MRLFGIFKIEAWEKDEFVGVYTDETLARKDADKLVDTEGGTFEVRPLNVVSPDHNEGLESFPENIREFISLEREREMYDRAWQDRFTPSMSVTLFEYAHASRENAEALIRCLPSGFYRCEIRTLLNQKLRSGEWKP